MESQIEETVQHFTKKKEKHRGKNSYNFHLNHGVTTSSVLEPLGHFSSNQYCFSVTFTHILYAFAFVCNCKDVSCRSVLSLHLPLLSSHSSFSFCLDMCGSITAVSSHL